MSWANSYQSKPEAIQELILQFHASDKFELERRINRLCEEQQMLVGGFYVFKYRGITYKHSRTEHVPAFKVKMLHKSLESKMAEYIEYVELINGNYNKLAGLFRAAVMLSTTPSDLYFLLPSVCHDKINFVYSTQTELHQDAIDSFHKNYEDEINALKAVCLLAQLESA